MKRQSWDTSKLRQIWQQRQRQAPAHHLKTSVDKFMRKAVIPRQKKLTQLARAWVKLLPEEMVDHSCLESFRGDQLQVLVDSAAHLAELDMMVREGLLDHLRQSCPSVPLARIRLIRGQWYRVDEEGHKIPYY